MEWPLSTTCSDSEDDTAQEVDEYLGSACTVNLSRGNATPDIEPQDLKKQKPMDSKEQEPVTLENAGKSAKELQLDPSTASGISSEKADVCKHWLRGFCKKGDQCIFLHEYDGPKRPVSYFYSRLGGISGEKAVVCKHWLRGLCNKGDQCLFLHEYDGGGISGEKTNVCRHWLRGFCKKGDQCLFLHKYDGGGISGEKTKVCRHWLRGFCKKGDQCQFHHEHDGEILTKRQRIRRRNLARTMKETIAKAALSQMSEVVIKVEKPQENELPSTN